MRNLIKIAILLVGLFFPTVTQAIDVDSITFYRKQNDTLRYQLYLASKKLESVKFYVRVVQKKPKNLKFLVGWIRRDLNMK